MVELLTGFEREYIFLGNNGGACSGCAPTLDAARNRLIAIDTGEHRTASNGKRSSRSPRTVLQEVGVVGDRFLRLLPERRPQSQAKVFDLRGQVVARRRAARAWARPAVSAAPAKTKRRFTRSPASPSPPTIYRYDMADGRKQRSFASRRSISNPADYETKQVFYTSKDGTRVPMFITLQERT